MIRAIRSIRTGPLGKRDFLLLFVSKATTSVGFWLTFIGLYALYVFDTEIGPIAIGGLGVVGVLPKVIGSPLLSPLVDQFERKRIIILTEFVSGALVLTLYVYESILVAYTVFFMLGLVSSIAGPAQDALVPQIVEEEELSRANGLLSSLSSGAQVAGPMLASMILLVVTPQILFLIDAITYVLSGVLLIGMSKYELSMESSTLLGDFTGGVRNFVSNKSRLVTLLLGLMMFVSIGAFEAMAPFYVREVLSRDASAYGAVATAVAIGSTAISVLIGMTGNRIREFNAMLLSVSVNGVCMIALSSVTNFYVALALAGGIGVSATGFIVNAVSIMQLTTEEEYMGRTMGILRGSTQGMQVLAMSVAGVLTSATNVFVTFSAAGGLMILFVCLTVLSFGGFGNASPTPKAESK